VSRRRSTMRLRNWLRCCTLQTGGEKGFSLIEVIVSLAILAIVGVSILSALGTSSRALITTDERETAKNIAETQIEYIKNLPYSNDYAPRDISLNYPGYSVVTDSNGKIPGQVIANRTDGNLQKLAISINHGSKRVLTVVGYKVR
jgi:prepilin-type N-terminal cleavage/methylation domain-containing protein